MITLVYDGNNTAYRANCVTELYNSEHKRTSAIFGMLKCIPADMETLESITGDTVGEVIVTWDCGKAKHRMELYPEYKANRRQDQTPEEKLWYNEFLEQAEYLHKVLPQFGVKTVKCKGWEADDIAYAIGDMYPNKKIVYVSTDEDWLQLINDNASVFSPIKKKYYTKDNFKELFGVDLTGFVEYKALRGDSSDNIPGVKGIGEKTGKKLINDYRSISNMLQNHSDALKKSKRLQPLLDSKTQEILKRNLLLMDLKNVDYSSISDSLELAISLKPMFNSKEVLSILKHNTFTSLIVNYTKFSREYKKLSE